ncbi:hemolysin family protein [Actinotalea sp.]|uniref:hemolysin family protein n=1 Tax=Actinotalea sp. TaxID=1872145 RepID=UPI003565B101
MDSVGYQLALLVVLIVLNAWFAGSEIALVSLRESKLRGLEGSGARGRTLARLARDPKRYLATIQIGITLAGFLAAATAAVSLAEPLVPLLGFLGAAAEPVAILGVTVVLTFLMLVLGELAPKRIALQRAERWALAVARPLDVLSRLAHPAVWLLGGVTDALVRLVGLDPKEPRDEISPAELRDLVTGHGGFTPEQREIIAGAVEITHRALREVLVPRLHVFVLRADDPVAEARTALAVSGYSRAPVVRGGGLDDVVGVVTLQDLVVHGEGTAGDQVRPAMLLPESLPVADALRRFKAEHQQLALVVDEHGGVDGIVTLEDLLEEVVGEIYDETDRDVRAVVRQPDGSLLLPGHFPLHDLPDVGVELAPRPHGEATTLAGLVLAALGHVPTAPGEVVVTGGWRIEVTAVVGHAISSVRLTRAGPGEERGESPRPSEIIG